MSKSLSLDSLAGGALLEKFNHSMAVVMENIADPNTDYKTKRKINIELTIVSDCEREMLDISIVTKETLAKRAGTTAKVILDRTLDGEYVAAEYRKQIPGQQGIKVDTDTGEVLETAPVQELEGKITKGLKVIGQ